MRLRTRIALVIGLTVLVASALFAAIAYQTQKKSLIAGIDSKLYATAHLARSILPPDYHDKIQGAESVSEDEYLRIVDRWNQLCKELGLEYIWSLLWVEGRIVFTSGSSTSKDVSRGDHALFFEEHTNPEAYDEVFRTMEPVYQEIVDKWGQIRAVLVPFQNVHGRRYLFGASMKTTEVDALARRTLWISLGIGSVILGLGLILSFWLAGSLSRPLERLSEFADGLSQGEDTPPAGDTGIVEIESLTRSLDSMNRSIQEKIAELQGSNEALQLEVSERERAEEALKKSERLYRDAIEVAGAVPYYQTYDPDAYTFVGSQIKEMLGCAPEDLGLFLDRATEETVPIRNLEGLTDDEAIAKCRTEGVTWHSDQRVRLPNGEERWIANSAIQIRDDSGDIVGSLGILRDITDRKKSEGALRKSEELFRVLYEGTTSCILFIEDRKMKYVNQATLRTFGYARAEMIGRDTSLIHVSREKYEEGGRTVYAALEEEGAWQGEWPFRKRSGEIIWMENNISALPSGGIVAILHDVSERRRAEEALKESEERLMQIAETIEDVFWITDWANHRTLFASPAYEKIWGRSLQDLYADPRNWADAIHPDDRKAAWENFVRLGEGSSYDEEYRIVRPDGSVRWIHDQGYPVRDESGGVYRVAGFAQDITDRKRAEEERLSLERQVQQAQKLESLGVLAGGIAHDFNNLLMAILGNADLALLDLSPHAPARDNVKEIEKAALRAAGLSKQMLAYSGRGQFSREPIYLNEFVAEMAHLLDVSISKKAALKYDYGDDLPCFEGDGTQIRQIIMNLITNASEALGDGSGVISIATGTMECDRAYLDTANAAFRVGLDDELVEGVYVFLEVSDSGCGMDEDTLSKVFDPFFTTKFTGRGLGMAAVLGIVRGHRGVIKIYSEPDKGTTFKVLFPLGESVDAPSVPYRATEEEVADLHLSGKALLADDEETVRVVGKRMLERLGFEVVVAEDGQEAVELFAEHSGEIVCILLDLTMPRLDGVEAFREIRRIRGDARVVLCSGYNEQDAVKRFAGKGLAGFLQKPYTSSALKDKVCEILSGG